jgi:hypothetical protein
MPEFDEVLRSTLQSKAASNTPHPDPDLLSAFAEQALKKEERAAVAMHISLCAECRELLSLVSAERVPIAMPQRVRWPAWTAAGVAMAAGCALVYLSIPRSKPPSNAVLVARNAPPPALEVAIAPETQPAPRKLKTAKRASTPVPAATPNEMQADPSPAPTSALVNRASPAQDREFQMVPSAPAMKSFQQTVGAKAAAPSVRWSIDAFAELQRSFDGGRTWESVHAADGAAFRALAVDGAQIWAGGSGGILVHSSDSGAHWDRIAVADGDRSLTGAIASITVSAGHLDLATSSGERWTSADGGLHWK